MFGEFYDQGLAFGPKARFQAFALIVLHAILRSHYCDSKCRCQSV